MNPFSQREPWVPNQDIFVNQLGELIIEIELSSLRPEDVSIELNGDCLLVSGNRIGNADNLPLHYLVRQIARGIFSFNVKIAPSFAADASRAVYSNGILRICVPPTDAFRERLHPPEPPFGGA